jgi:hypothetical protein
MVEVLYINIHHFIMIEKLQTREQPIGPKLESKLST